MAASKEIGETVRFGVENIGGIDETDVSIPPGVTVLTGKNATNRTSFLQAVMAAMGSDQATLKGDAEKGRVEMDIGGETVERTLARTGESVQFSGGGYLDDPEVADLFAFLLESNEARQAVARGGNLREIIMRPVDVGEIRAEIERLEDRKAEINDELAEIEARQRDLPTLEQRRNALRDQIEEKREALADTEEAIDASSQNVEQGRKEQQALESKLEELRSTRSELESVRRDIESQQESINALEQERTDLESELEELPETPMGDRQYREEELARLRDRRQTLNTEISELQSLVQYNEERLEEGDYGVLDSLDDTPDAGSDGSVTDQLLEDEEAVVCWTCGSTVEREQIEDTIDRLKELRSETVEALDEVTSELEDLKEAQREARREQDRREELERTLADIDDEIDRRERRIDSLKDQRETLTDRVESLEAEVDALESEEFEEILSLHREANQLEFEIDRLESDLEEVTEEIEAIEGQVERAEDLRGEREDVVEALADQRTKIDQIEAEAVEAFNEHMDAVLDVLEYENLDRIWIERVTGTVREGRGTVEQTFFELHVVRSTESGTAYEDTVEHLSESEREVMGLIFALAGYLVHDLHESVPFMLLDSLEAIDADRIAALVDYFADYADYLVVALLPEDAQALDDAYNRVTAI
jgi:DNA repair exonuclease SbcCD ATPase subunit